MKNSQVTLHKGGGFTLEGPDAINLYRAATVASGLRLYAETKILLTRGATPTHLLLLAGEYVPALFARLASISFSAFSYSYSSSS